MNFNKNVFLQFWKKFSEIHFASLVTDKADLIYDGDLEVGTDVLVERDGEFVPAEDGDYTVEDGTVITIKDGKVENIEKPTPVVEEEVVAEEDSVADVTEPEKDEKDLKIEELEGLLKDRDAIIEELTAKIKELEDKANAPAAEEVEVKASAQSNDKNKFNQFFK